MASTVDDDGEPGIQVDAFHRGAGALRWLPGPPASPLNGSGPAGVTGHLAGPPMAGQPAVVGPEATGWAEPPPFPPPGEWRLLPTGAQQPLPPDAPSAAPPLPAGSPSASWQFRAGEEQAAPPGASRVLPPPPPPGEWENPSWPATGSFVRPAVDPGVVIDQGPGVGTAPVPTQFIGPDISGPHQAASTAGHRLPVSPDATRLPAVPDPGPRPVEPSSLPSLPARSTGPQTAVETGPLDVVPLTHLGGSAVGRRAAPPAFRPNSRRRLGGGLRRRSEPAVVSVDNNRCHLYAICQQEAPASFLVARDGRLYYDAAPPEHLMASVRQAARLCPMQAITLGSDVR